MCVHMWNSWLLGALHVMILSHSAADELNVQSNGNNAAIVAVRILPRGGSLDECTHLWYHDVLWIKALSKMTHTHTHTHVLGRCTTTSSLCLYQQAEAAGNKPTHLSGGWTHERDEEHHTTHHCSDVTHRNKKKKRLKSSQGGGGGGGLSTATMDQPLLGSLSCFKVSRITSEPGSVSLCLV